MDVILDFEVQAVHQQSSGAFSCNFVERQLELSSAFDVNNLTIAVLLFLGRGGRVGVRHQRGYAAMFLLSSIHNFRKFLENMPTGVLTTFVLSIVTA
jgi:hypothetical protein